MDTTFLLALLPLGLAVAAGLTTRVALLRWWLLGSAALVPLAWVPLLVVGSLDPDGNPIGLGLLAVFGSGIGLLGAGIGLVGWGITSLARLAGSARSGGPGPG